MRIVTSISCLTLGALSVAWLPEVVTNGLFDSTTRDDETPLLQGSADEARDNRNFYAVLEQGLLPPR